ncbi:MAG: nitroreductase family protein [Anaerolineales bacterium]|nr:nitroreductase family protein [Anaerolineales bacterium]
MITLDLLAWLRSRRSARYFRREAVPAQVLQRILETATWAPNAHNRQPWRFVQLAGTQSRQALLAAMQPGFEAALLAEGLDGATRAAQVARSQQRVLDAPEVLLLCLDTEVLTHYQDPQRNQGEYMMGVQSVALAGGQLLLAAHAEGLGGVWVCAPLFAAGPVGQALELPPSWQAQGMILLGYAEGEAKPRERRDLAEIFRRL